MRRMPENLRVATSRRSQAGAIHAPRSCPQFVLVRPAVLGQCLPVVAMCRADGCTDWWRNGFKVGPNYSRPPAPVASQWIDYADPRVKSEEQQLCHWWTVFNDPTLNTLIQTAYQQNLTLRVAGARILEARALAGHRPRQSVSARAIRIWRILTH